MYLRKLEKGSLVCISEKKPEDSGQQKQQATDMITFRCANEICPNYFPLKVSFFLTPCINDTENIRRTLKRRSSPVLWMIVDSRLTSGRDSS